MLQNKKKNNTWDSNVVPHRNTSSNDNQLIVECRRLTSPLYQQFSACKRPFDDLGVFSDEFPFHRFANHFLVVSTINSEQKNNTLDSSVFHCFTLVVGYMFLEQLIDSRLIPALKRASVE
jgi:hypothetical protein